MNNVWNAITGRITVHCFPVACTRDSKERASQPFRVALIAVPRIDEYIEYDVVHKIPGQDAEVHRHLYKVIRVTWSEKYNDEVKVLVIEDVIQKQVIA